MKKEAKLQWELMVKESKAQIVAAIAIVNASAAVFQQKLLVEEDNITDEVLFEVMSIIFCFISFFQEKIIRICYNKFKLINFY